MDDIRTLACPVPAQASPSGVGALYNHTIQGTPEQYVMHFRASGAPDAVADCLTAALGALRH